MNARTLLLLCTGLLVSVSASARAGQPYTIVTLGDSITKGVRTGVTKEQTFAFRLEKQLREGDANVNVINVGVGGERTDQALKRIDRVAALNPKFVTVMYGTNDSYVDSGKRTSRISVEAYRDNLTKIVVELLRRGIAPILMTEPRWSDKASPNGLGESPNVRLEPYVDACREVAREWRLPLVDHYARWTAARKAGVTLHDWTTDGCHPNPAGHKELAKAILPVLGKAHGPDLKTREKLLAGESVRIVCFGDSVTGVYYHTGSRRAYTDMLGVALRKTPSQPKVEMINAGISGNTTVNGLARIDKDVLRHKPDLVTVMFGLNDMVRTPLETYRANLKQIVDKCREAGAEVVLATPNNVINTSGRPTDKLLKYCDAVREVGRELNATVADCYREFDAIREHDPFEWRLHMSDAIHPNMDGHKQIAVQLGQAIVGRRMSLQNTGPYQPALQHTLAQLRAEKPVRVLAMPPLDAIIKPEIQRLSPNAKVEVTAWPVEGMSLAAIEQDAKTRVRKMRPDLVVIAVPRSASAESREAFANSFAWIMNWSLNFGSPTWDCVVVHPSVTEPQGKAGPHEALIGRLVPAQDLSLIRKMAAGSDPTTPAEDLRAWFQSQAP